ncbi:alpha/beta hydrolase [Tropicimonas sp. IMCC6043]|uniref:alpha/beta hydrolase n=1 Tax=Tropicimonas sp. IMCC6043 TaxID=2510645 RepID=UPI00101DBDE9|nr:alpha/beta hydrolase fold domain-containing protein [Tropicimonas sp. IMCC6043]RYH08314.1 steryl acetyl hydrolase [Tropicimonas sp. IMCC6043]
MSRRLRILNVLLRSVVKPRLAATKTPEQAEADFARFARFVLRAPRGLHCERRAGLPELQWICADPTADRPVLLYFHGGGYISGSPRAYRGMLGRLSQLSGVKVAAAAYRLAPDHPAPAQFEDAKAVHDSLLAEGFRPDEIILGGDSAGGGLALALLADLCARDRHPAGAFAISPWVDLTLSGASMVENAARDPLLPADRADDLVGFVLGGIAADDPRVSPLFAAFADPPPVRLHVGTTEILRDDSRRMEAHLRAAGGRVSLREWPEAPHLWPIFDGYIPEARETLEDLAEFIRALDAP